MSCENFSLNSGRFDRAHDRQTILVELHFVVVNPHPVEQKQREENDGEDSGEGGKAAHEAFRQQRVCPA